MGWRMRFGDQTGAAIARSGEPRGDFASSPSIDPWTDESTGSDTDGAGRIPEIDCVRTLLAADVLAAAAQRAAMLGVGADRVLSPPAR